jgi:hypothetical protein
MTLKKKTKNNYKIIVGNYAGMCPLEGPCLDLSGCG